MIIRFRLPAGNRILASAWLDNWAAKLDGAIDAVDAKLKRPVDAGGNQIAEGRLWNIKGSYLHDLILLNGDVVAAEITIEIDDALWDSLPPPVKNRVRRAVADRGFEVF